MPPNFGILPTLPMRIKSKQERYGAYRDRSLTDLIYGVGGLRVSAA
jgi:methylenetetrahydrofolate--tRNA-(uracil-5-)-methyltransferase